MITPSRTVITIVALCAVRQKKLVSCQPAMLSGCLGLLTLVTMCGCDDTKEVTTSERKELSEVEMVAAMEVHYTMAILAHDALIQGDIETFRSQLIQLDTLVLPANAPESWQGFYAQLHAAAGQASEVTDSASAAKTMAAVVSACGSCHQGTDSGPVYPVPPLAERGLPLKDTMAMHEWAAQMLWNGVTGPSDYAWQRGAEGLAKTRIFGEGKWIVDPDSALLESEAALRALGEEAGSATTLAARADVYGRMLVTCGACHQATRVMPKPYQPQFPAEPQP